MKIYLVGIGMGGTFTQQAQDVIQRANCLLGAKRMLDSVQSKAKKIEAIAPEDIAGKIHGSQHETVAVLLSGDIGFYSGAKKLLEFLDKDDVECIAGVSSVQYFCAKLQRPWQDIKLMSLHGRNCDVVTAVMRNKVCFFLTDAVHGPAYIGRELTRAGLSDVLLNVGEKLSYPEEKITTGSAAEMGKKEFDPLSVVIVDNDFAVEENCVHGLEDECFSRGETPMTKQEVRSVALSKLQLKSTDIVYDLGGGTGSVSVEMARQCTRVYSVECNESAVHLLKENREKFRSYNLEIVQGKAPQALEDLPSPDAAFIGGTRGNMAKILACLAKKNPKVRLVITAIALETLAEAVAELSKYCSINVTQIAASRNKKVGQYNMMKPENPIWIVYGEMKQ